MQELQIISREAAYMAGKRRYYLGTPCKNGHYSERYVSNGCCVGCLNGAYKYRVNSFSHELAPYTSPRLWIPKSLKPQELPDLERYLQRCIVEFARHNGKLSEDLEDAFKLQIEKM